MSVYHLVWEDVAKNRDVEILVKYQLTDGAVEIRSITPTSVHLYENDRETATQVLPVTKETGRRLLTEAFTESRVGGHSLEQEIEAHLAV